MCGSTYASQDYREVACDPVDLEVVDASLQSWQHAPHLVALILRNHVCKITQHVITCHSVSGFHITEAPRKVSQWACNTLNALTTSFLVSSCICAKRHCFLPWGLDKSSQTPPIKDRYHRQDSTPFCSCACWWCSCTLDHPRHKVSWTKEIARTHWCHC